MRAAIVLTVLAAAGCAQNMTVYRPAAVVPGKELIPSYQIPSGSPKGALRVLTLGGERLPVGPGAPDVYLHFRLSAENDADAAPWTLDPNEQFLVFEGGTLPPAYSQTSQASPVLSLARGERGYLDVYYPMPDIDPARVSLSWRLRRGGEVTAELTSFDRVSGRVPDSYFADYDPSPGTSAYFGLGLGWFWPDYCWRWHGAYLAPYSHRRDREVTGDAGGRSYTSHTDVSHRTWVPPAGNGDSGSPPPSVGNASGNSGSSSGDAAKSAWRR
jgi:hypothetical protein